MAAEDLMAAILIGTDGIPRSYFGHSVWGCGSWSCQI